MRCAAMLAAHRLGVRQRLIQRVLLLMRFGCQIHQADIFRLLQMPS